MRYIAVLAIAAIHLSSPFPAFSQNPDEELLSWSAERRLTWKDYKGMADSGSDAAASTATYLSVEYSFSNNQFGYIIKSYFSKTRSWGLHKTDYILSHEQGHFDIAEIFARKLHKALNEYRFNKRTYQKDLKNIYTRITQEKDDTQNAYDRETNHSINRVKQAEWLEKISKMLKEYKDYADY